MQRHTHTTTEIPTRSIGRFVLFGVSFGSCGWGGPFCFIFFCWLPYHSHRRPSLCSGLPTPVRLARPRRCSRMVRRALCACACYAKEDGERTRARVKSDGEVEKSDHVAAKKKVFFIRRATQKSASGNLVRRLEKAQKSDESALFFFSHVYL